MGLPRMKVRFLRLKGKEVFLILLVVLCGTILLWSWERTPFVSTLLPPKNLLRVFSDVEVEAENERVLDSLENIISERSTSLADGEEGHRPVTKKETMNGQETVLDMEDKQFLRVGKNRISDVSSLTEREGKHEQNGEEETLNKQDVILGMAPLVKSMSSAPSMAVKELKNSETLEENHGCNYAKGKWVVDDSRPLYSGFGCKQWLSPMWACRLMQREDFTYEKLRWQPNNCQMEDFEGSKFLKRMRNKTVAVVGDSLGRQQFQSLMCMITGGEETLDVIDVGSEYGLIQPEGGVRPDGWAYRFPSTSTTVLYYWSACLCGIEPINITNPKTDFAMHLDRPPYFLEQYLNKLDVLVLNTGHHWNRAKVKANRWVMYVGGKPNTNSKLLRIGDAKNFTIHSIVSWVNSQLPKHPHLKAFYRSISPRHFVNGDWNTGGSCDNTTPMSVGKEVLQDESSDYSAGSAVKGTRVNLLDITALSQLRDEGHISKYSITASAGVQDCLHWCLPGVPDTWNEILFAQISSFPGVKSV